MSFRINDTSYKSEDENEDENEDEDEDDHKDDHKDDSKDEDDNSPTHKKKSIKKVPVIQTKHNSSYSFKVNYDSTNQPDYF